MKRPSELTHAELIAEMEPLADRLHDLLAEIEDRIDSGDRLPDEESDLVGPQCARLLRSLCEDDWELLEAYR